MEFSVIDVETTGLAPGRGDRVVEIAVITLDERGDTVGEFVSVVNPQRDVGPTHIHGLTAGDVKAAPVFVELAGEILARLDGTVAIAAHNCSFDWRFLASELDRIGVQSPDAPRVCTMRLAGGGKLAACCEEWDVDPPGNAHSALSDARAAAALLGVFLGHGRIEHREPIRWPEFPVSGRAALARSNTRQNAPAHSYLSRLTDLTPTRLDVNVPEAEGMAYLALLLRALEDRRIEDREAEELISAATEWGLSAQHVDTIHHDFLKHLVVAALVDGIVTESERSDLERVGLILARPSGEIANLLREAEARLAAAKEQSNGAENHDLTGKTVCFTGTLRAMVGGLMLQREDAHLLASGAGLKVATSVTKKLDILVVADLDSMSGKARKARDYGTRIIEEEAFWKMLGISARF